jgi:hypothetical protein
MEAGILGNRKDYGMSWRIMGPKAGRGARHDGACLVS